jgi:hypothetical protein
MSIKELSSGLNLDKQNDGFIGEMNGYYYSAVQENRGSISMSLINFVFTESIDGKLKSQLAKTIKTSIQYKTLKNQKDTLSIMLPYKMLKSTEKYLEQCVKLVTKAIEFFKEHNMVQYKSCYFCNQEKEEELTMTLYGMFCVPIHVNCLNAYVNRAEAELKVRNEMTQNIPLSILLAIIGSIVAAIPNAIMMFSTNMIYVYLYMLIPLGAYFGYKLGKAPFKKYSTVIIIVLSLIIAVVMQLWYANTDAINKGWNSIFHAFEVQENLNVFLEDLGKSVLFLGLGVFACWKLITNTNDVKMNEIRNMRKH